jgi:hypothetical protein
MPKTLYSADAPTLCSPLPYPEGTFREAGGNISQLSNDKNFDPSNDTINNKECIVHAYHMATDKYSCDA